MATYRIHYKTPDDRVGFVEASGEDMDSFTGSLTRAVRSDGFLVTDEMAVPAKYVTYVERVGE